MLGVWVDVKGRLTQSSDMDNVMLMAAKVGGALRWHAVVCVGGQCVLCGVHRER